jgi:hypothetical protein
MLAGFLATPPALLILWSVARRTDEIGFRFIWKRHGPA